MLINRRWFVAPNTQTRVHFFIKSVALYAYDAVDVMDDDNLATVLESNVISLLLHAAQVNMMKVPAFDHLVLAKKWCI